MLNTNTFTKINNYYFFFISIFIVFFFYIFEGIIGIDRFYHPDSLNHYLTPNEKVPKFIDNLNNPGIFLNFGYEFFCRIFNYNYKILILLNFIFYSITNIIIYNKIFKKLILRKNQFQIFILFYILFLEPYRLHLASHILKETLLILLISILIFSSNLVLKSISVILIEFTRKNSIIYLLILINYKSILKLFKKIITKYKKNTNKHFKYYFFLFLFLFVFICFLNFEIIYKEIITLFDKYYFLFRVYFFGEMSPREYDQISNFQEYGYHLGFWLKVMIWPVLFISGSFALFTSSYLFKLLGLLIILNHYLIFKITNKSFISLGFIFLIMVISIYSTSYTAMYRYSFIGYYFSILYFFYKFEES